MIFSFLALGFSYDVGDVPPGIDWTYVWFRHSEVTQVEVYERSDGIHYCIILELELSLVVFLRVERQPTNGHLDYMWQGRLRILMTAEGELALYVHKVLVTFSE